jgi:hypothetical protein
VLRLAEESKVLHASFKVRPSSLLVHTRLYTRSREKAPMTRRHGLGNSVRHHVVGKPNASGKPKRVTDFLA